MKLDDFLPEYDVRSQHSVEIDAATAEVYAAISATSFSQIPLVRRLLTLRGLGGERANKRMRESLLQGCFIKLCNLPDEEIAFGLPGKFWQAIGRQGAA